ncbi:hypothetical protein ILUMI_23966 [Ignelater luminosus]|uniref:Neurotransmitter-gated ion-channel ligand-binding domain-containing protein n=1 Tax=Ignelater luminosus TaxID=2038154 RepID=A0A8K0C9Z5_IGNLU|nr:hypothetical protein ILUMI_23966 [Ignelater luminosus]
MVNIVSVCVFLFYISREVTSQVETIVPLRQDLLARNSKHVLDAPNQQTKVINSAQILDIEKLNEDDMELSVKILLHRSWNDYRLVYGDQVEGIKKLPIPNSIWTPTICFLNDKKDQIYGRSHIGDQINVLPDGTVHYDKRFSVTVQCAADKKLIPFGRILCTVRWAPCGPSEEEINLSWDRNRPISFGEYLHFSPYRLEEVVVYGIDRDGKTDMPNILYLSFNFSREFYYYFSQIYLPYSLLILFSWLQFWLNKNNSTSRILIGLTAFLMCILISYKKDHFQVSCFISSSFLLIFSALIESVIVLNLEQKENQTINDEFKETNGKLMFIRKLLLIKAKDIDRKARWIFPLIFMLFSITYFSYGLVYKNIPTTRPNAFSNVTVIPFIGSTYK